MGFFSAFGTGAANEASNMIDTSNALAVKQEQDADQGFQASIKDFHDKVGPEVAKRMDYWQIANMYGRGNTALSDQAAAWLQAGGKADELDTQFKHMNNVTTPDDYGPSHYLAGLKQYQDSQMAQVHTALNATNKGYQGRWRGAIQPFYSDDNLPPQMSGEQQQVNPVDIAAKYKDIPLSTDPSVAAQQIATRTAMYNGKPVDPEAQRVAEFDPRSYNEMQQKAPEYITNVPAYQAAIAQARPDIAARFITPNGVLFQQKLAIAQAGAARTNINMGDNKFNAALGTSQGEAAAADLQAATQAVSTSRLADTYLEQLKDPKSAQGPYQDTIDAMGNLVHAAGIDPNTLLKAAGIDLQWNDPSTHALLVKDTANIKTAYLAQIHKMGVYQRLTNQEQAQFNQSVADTSTPKTAAVWITVLMKAQAQEAAMKGAALQQDMAKTYGAGQEWGLKDYTKFQQDWAKKMADTELIPHLNSKASSFAQDRAAMAPGTFYIDSDTHQMSQIPPAPVQ